MGTRMLPARHLGKLGKTVAEPKAQLALGDLVTCEAARVLHSVKQKRERKADKPKPEDDFDYQLRSQEFPSYVRQHRFAKEAIGRGWQFDFAWVQYKLAVEIEGLVMRKLLDANTREPVWCVYGRHATITGMVEDMTKYNTAAILGWHVMRFEQKAVKDGSAAAETMRFLYSRGWAP
jgi:hypothetical protein